MQFPAENSFPMSNVDKIKNLMVFHNANKKYKFKKLNLKKF